jgi:hypothetical protein
MFRLQSNRPCRDDVFNDHAAILHHNSIHYQLYHLLLHLPSRVFQGPPDTGAKSIDSFEESPFSGPICPLLLNLPDPLPQHPPMVFDPVAPLGQFGQLDHPRLIGVNQPRHFPVESGEFPLEAHVFLVGLDMSRRVAASLFILPPQDGGVGQQCLHVIPNPSLDGRRTEATACACPRHIPWVAEGIEIPPALGAPSADHAPVTTPTDQQTPQQRGMLRVVTQCPLPILCELGLRPLPERWINECGHPDRDPFGLGAPRAALAIAGLTIFESLRSIGPPHIPRMNSLISTT